MKAYRIHFIIAFAIVVLSGCGPSYRTDYTFKPPKDRSGRRCILKCLDKKQACNLQCDKTRKQCQLENQKTELVNDLMHMTVPAKTWSHTSEDRHGNTVTGTSMSTSVQVPSFTKVNCNTDCGCDSIYRACYTTCGGEVEAHTVCVSGCKK